MKAKRKRPKKTELVIPPSEAYKLKWFDQSPTYTKTGAGWYWVDGWVAIWALARKKA